MCRSLNHANPVEGSTREGSEHSLTKGDLSSETERHICVSSLREDFLGAAVRLPTSERLVFGVVCKINSFPPNARGHSGTTYVKGAPLPEGQCRQSV